MSYTIINRSTSHIKIKIGLNEQTLLPGTRLEKVSDDVVKNNPDLQFKARDGKIALVYESAGVVSGGIAVRREKASDTKPKTDKKVEEVKESD